MPELPEVETTVRDLRRLLVGRIITGLTFNDWPRLIQTHDPEVFGKLIAGETVLDVTRRAKYAIIALSHDKYLMFHRKMTGDIYVRETGAEPDRFTHVVIGFENGGELRYADSRKFGRIYLFLSQDELLKHLAKLGPEPLLDDFTLDVFERQIAGKRGMLKPALLNQSVLVGLGNIYVDESLWLSQLHPQRSVETLTGEERLRLYNAIRTVLERGIQNRGTTFSDYRDAEGNPGNNQEFLAAYNRVGQPCILCGSPIVKAVVGQRGTYFCETCQPIPEGVTVKYANQQRPVKPHLDN